MNAGSLREVALCLAAGARLSGDGWRVACEVPYGPRRIDLVATRDGEVIVIEAKAVFSHRLQSQIGSVAWLANYAIAVVGSTPRENKLALARRFGIGVWQVTADGEVHVHVDAPRRAAPAGAAKSRLIERAHRMEASTLGGRPCLAGEGPAIEAQKKIQDYCITNPGASWAAVFRAVPNHYATSRSLAGAMAKRGFRLPPRGGRVSGQEEQAPHT